MPKTRDEINQEKEVAFYASCVNAWVESSNELDKSLLTLSAGGIGLLVTLMTTVGVNNSAVLVLYFIACICFLLSLTSVLIALRWNQTYIEEVIAGEKTENDIRLKIIDNIAISTFFAGVLSVSIIGAGAAIDSYAKPKEVNVMSDGKMKHTNDKENISYDNEDSIRRVHIAESVNGIYKLSPKSAQPVNSNSQDGPQKPDATPSQTEKESGEKEDKKIPQQPKP